MNRESKLYAYAISPLDWGWESLPTVLQFAERIVRDYGLEGAEMNIGTLREFAEAAEGVGGEVGWEGDYRPGHEPRVLSLPGVDDWNIALVWKQENNGTTFVVSQVPLPWLGEARAFSMENAIAQHSPRRRLFR